MKQFPPKPLFALTLGVTGHRLRRDKKQGENAANQGPEFDVAKVKAGIDHFLRLLKEAVATLRWEEMERFDPGPPVIALVSSLAEGSDRIAAESALAIGMSLDVVLPCARATYEQTFADDASRKDFSGLLGQARACLILPAPANYDLTRAYEVAGLTVLAQADILIAVWDGEPARGRGGTGDIVEEAVRQGTPIVVISPISGGTHLLWRGGPFPLPVLHATDLPAVEITKETLIHLIRSLAFPPRSEIEGAGLDMFLSTGVQMGGELGSQPAEKRLERLTSSASTRGAGSESAASNSNRYAVRHLFEAFVAAEKIAEHNARAFRSAFVFNFLAGAIAVACIGGAIVKEAWHHWLVAAELMLMVIVLVSVSTAVRRQWHRRWFEARELAERLRIAEIFWMLGIWPRNLAPAQPTWPGWYARATLRAQPLFSGDLGTLLADARAALAVLLDDQCAYHAKNIAYRQKIDRLLERLGQLFLAALVANALLFLSAYWASWQGIEEWKSYSLMTAIVLSAFATAIYGIRVFGDYEDIVHRSARTGEALRVLRALLDKDPDDLLTVRGRAGQAAAAMLSDLEAWRVAVESRYLAPT